jgi:hypothetical protein
MAGEQRIALAEENLRKRDMARESLSSSQGTDILEANISAAIMAGGAIGSFIAPGAGTLVGATAGLISGLIGTAIAGGTSSKTETDALEKLEAAYLEDDTVL